MRVLLIGLGGFGKHHLRVWRELGQEVFLCDQDAGRLALGDPYNIPADHRGTRYEPFLDRVDAVDIVTPTDAHHPIAQACLEAGKDLFIEKPVTLRSHEARALQRLSERQRRIVQVGHIFRFNPAAQYIKAAIGEGRLGAVRYLQGLFKGFKRMRTDVGVTQTDSIHFFDIFTWFMGHRPQAVTAITRDYAGRQLDDLSHAFLEYEGGVLGHVESGYFDPDTYRHITVIGDRAAVRSDVVAQRVELFRNRHARQGSLVTASSDGMELPHVITKEPLELELRAFLQCVQTRSRPLAGLEEGYVTLKITEAAYESSASGRRVPITYDDAPRESPQILTHSH